MKQRSTLFITGGTSGIGLAFARHYQQLGYRVGVCGGSYHGSEPFRKENPNLAFYEWDVTDHEQGREVIKQFCAGDPLDKIIMCAGINDGKPHASATVDFNRARAIIDVNVKGVINAMDAATPYLGAGSHLIVLSSAAALSGFPSAPAYSASKAAIMILCESLAIRFKPLAIDVTCLMPGYIDTALARSTHPQLEKMPFVLTTEQALKHMLKAIDARKSRLIFPWQIKVLGLLFQLMPRTLFSWIYTRIENSDQAKKTRGNNS